MSPTLTSNDVLASFEAEISRNRSTAEINEARLENITSEANRKRVEGIVAGSRSRMNELAAKTTEIKTISDPLTQKEDYSVELWNDRFKRLGDINELDGMFQDGEQLRMMIWNRLPDSRFKRIQELFCQPQDFCVPHFQVVNGKIVFPAETRFHEVSLDPILIDINLVPDSLLENLQIVEFPEEDPVGHLRAKREALPRLKEIFETATQLSPKNKRILIIASPHNQTASIEADAKGAPDAVEGAILYMKTDDKRKSATAKTQYEKRSVQFFPNGYNAHRKTKHEEIAYSNEIGKLTKLIVQIKNLTIALDDGWKQETPDAEKTSMRQRANELFKECAECLQYCSNLYKVKARTRVSKIQSLISNDIKTKPNIGAAMTCMTSARESLQERNSKDIVEKSGFNQNDRAALEVALRAQERTLADYGTGIINIAYRFKNNLEIFNADVHAEKMPSKTSGFLAPIKPELLDTITMAPFTAYAATLKGKYDALGSAVSLQNKEKAAEILVQMHVIKKFSDVQRVFEKIKETVIDPRYVSVDVIRTFITDLNDEFFTFQIFPELIVENYVPAYENMKSALGAIERRLTHYEGTNTMNIEERTEMYGRLKEYLDTFNIPAIVEDLE